MQLALSHEESTDKGHMIKWGSDPAPEVGSKLKFKNIIPRQDVYRVNALSRRQGEIASVI